MERTHEYVVFGMPEWIRQAVKDPDIVLLGSDEEGAAFYALMRVSNGAILDSFGASLNSPEWVSAREENKKNGHGSGQAEFVAGYRPLEPGGADMPTIQ